MERRTATKQLFRERLASQEKRRAACGPNPLPISMLPKFGKLPKGYFERDIEIRRRATVIRELRESLV